VVGDRPPHRQPCRQIREARLYVGEPLSTKLRCMT
jgi:hypothetical protein